MKIEKTGFYKTKHGNRVRIVCVDGDYPNQPIIDSNGCRYTRDGNSLSSITSENDILSEWDDEGEVAALLELLSVAKCPNCDGVGWYTRQISDDECVQEQCQWCNEVNGYLNRSEQSAKRGES